MAIWAVKSAGELDTGFVLAPERYDPRRAFTLLQASGQAGIPLGKIVTNVRRTVTASASWLRACIILDTSDAKEGMITSPKSAAAPEQIGSTKKVVAENDVLISRLRPYLRQVAFVDGEIRHWNADVTLLCSTEFFVLRSVDADSIAFLVPFLLCDPVQSILAAAQEGGHHPRFAEATLLTLPVPIAILQNRAEISRSVEKSVHLYRESERSLAEMTEAYSIICAALPKERKT